MQLICCKLPMTKVEGHIIGSCIYNLIVGQVYVHMQLPRGYAINVVHNYMCAVKNEVQSLAHAHTNSVS